MEAAIKRYFEPGRHRELLRRVARRIAEIRREVSL